MANEKRDHPLGPVLFAGCLLAVPGQDLLNGLIHGLPQAARLVVMALFLAAGIGVGVIASRTAVSLEKVSSSGRWLVVLATMLVVTPIMSLIHHTRRAMQVPIIASVAGIFVIVLIAKVWWDWRRS